MKKLLFIFPLMFSVLLLTGQTVLIDPDGDGGFENGATPVLNNWTAVNSSTDEWVVGDVPTPSDGVNCAYVSSDGGTSWLYSQVSTIQHLYYDVTIPTGEPKLTLTFKWKVGGEGSGTSDWDNMKVFYGLASSISPAANTAIGAGFQVSGSGAVSGMYKLNSASWNSETITLTGIPGSTYRLVFSWKSDVSDIVNPPASIDEVSLTSEPTVPLIGGTVYPINNVSNPPVEFVNITEAVSYIASEGVTGTGQVIFELGDDYDSSTEPAPINIPNIGGTSSTLGIAFRPAAGVTALTSIAGAASPNQFAIRITGSYITLDGRAGGTGTGRDWTVRVTGTTNAQSAVRINNSAPITAINVRNLIMEASATGTTAAILQIGTSSTAANTISDVVIENNLIQSETTTALRGYGITTGSASSSTSNTGLIIRNNEITRFATRGINLTAGFPAQEVHGNKIYFSEAHAGSSEFAGIYFATTSAPGTKIYKNFIYNIEINNTTSTAINGIYLFSGNTSGDRIQVYNNVIVLGDKLSGTPANLPVWGIRDNSATGALIDIYYNSVAISGVAASGTNNSAAFYKQLSNNLNIHNNIFFSNRSGGTGNHWAISVNNTTFTSIGNNDYWSTGVLGTTTGAAAGNRTTLAAWKAAVPADVTSVSQNPNFVNLTASPPDLNINTTIASQLESGGIVITGINEDFEGTPRYPNSGYPEKPGFPASAPDIGAFEFGGEPLDLIPPVFSYTALQHTTSTANRTLDNVSISDLSGINVTTHKPRVYFKKSTDPNDETGWQYTETTDVSSPFSFTIDNTLLGGVSIGDVIQYFVVAQDEAATPNIGISLGSFDAAQTSVVLQTDAYPIGGTINSYEIKPSISGIINVGTGETYESLTNNGGLFEAINNAVVTDNIVVKVVTSTSENGTHFLNQWAEESPGGFSLIIEPSSASMKTISGSSAGGLITLNGADNVTIDGSFSGTGRYLTIENTNTVTNTAAIRLISLAANQGATNNAIKNCVIKAGDIGTTTSLNTFGIYIGGTTITNSGTGADNDNVIIEGNHIMKSRYGIYARGSSIANANDNLHILNNEIGSADPTEYVTFRGIDITNAVDPIINGNYIHDLKIIIGASNAAIDMGIGVMGAVIANNIITGVWSESTGGWGAYGINFSSSSNVTNNSIINNVISDIKGVNYSASSTTFNGFGIRLVGGTNTNVFNNTIELSGDITIVSGVPTQPNSAALIVTSTAVTGLSVINNVLINTQTFVSGTPKTYSIWVPASYSFANINNNDYYGSASTPPTTYHVGRAGSDDYTTLGNWAGFTGQDNNSISADPLFTSATNLKPLAASPLKGKATPIMGITEDIEGTSRHASYPTIGAYEMALWILHIVDPGIGYVSGYTYCDILIIGPQGQLTLGQSATIEVGSEFRIESDATGTGSFIENGTLTVGNNNIIVEKYVATGTQTGWTLSIPVQNATDDVFMGSDQIWFYNSTTPGWEVFAGGPLNQMTGYVVRFEADHTINFTGALNNGLMSRNDLLRTGNNYGWNYVGNPYPSPIDCDHADYAISDLGNAIYIRTENGNVAAYTKGSGGLGGTNGATNIIPAMQAYWTQVLVGQPTGTLTVNNGARIQGANNILTTPTDLLKLRAERNGLTDETVIRFDNSATASFDNVFDAEKMFAFNNDLPQIFSLDTDQNQYAINTLNTLTNNVVVPLGFKTNTAGTHNIMAFDVSSFDSSVEVLLEDAVANTFVDLRQQNTYPFNASAGVTNNRFFVHFNLTTTDLENTVEGETSIYAYDNNIYVSNVTDENAVMYVYNMLGQEVLSHALNANTLNKVSADFAKGQYIVKVINNSKVNSQKIMIQ